MKKKIKISLGVLILAILRSLFILVFIFDPFALWTKTTPGFSRKMWNTVLVGDSRQDVIMKIGEPINKTKCDGENWAEFWHYSRKRNGVLLYRKYIVGFNSNDTNIVGGVISYIDD